MAYDPEDFQDSSLADLPAAEPLRFSFGAGVFNGSSEPDTFQDETKGFAPNSLWYFLAQGRLFICIDATANAAVWKELMMLEKFDTDGNGVIDRAAQVVIRCRNNTGSTLPKGTIVYVTGALGNHPTIGKADNATEAASSKTLGMLTEAVLNNGDGWVAINGVVEKLDTSAYSAGTPIWLGTNGGWTSTMPVQPNHSVFIGWVTWSNNNNGRIALHIQNGYELEELHNVKITGVTNGDGLIYDSSDSLWKNKRGARVIHSNGAPVEVEQAVADVSTVNIAANLLSTNNDGLRAIYTGSNVDPTAKLAVYFGATKLAEITDLYGGYWQINANLWRTNNTTLQGTISFLYENAGGSTNYITLALASGINLTTTGYDLFLRIDSTTADITTLVASRVEFLPTP